MAVRLKPNGLRGASEVYLRVGVHVEPARDAAGSGISKGIQLLSYAEPAIPEGGISYGGPLQSALNTNGSRRDCGSLFLHAKPVTLPKAQTVTSGIIESASSNVKESAERTRVHLKNVCCRGAFSESNIHRSGYQAIEVIRLTNLTPLLWVRVDPMGLYGGHISVFQPDACLSEMLFDDGDTGAQVDALRALAEQ
jgi:hypothetical protein